MAPVLTIVVFHYSSYQHPLRDPKIVHQKQCALFLDIASTINVCDLDLQNTHSILIRDIHSKALCLTQCFVFLDKVCGVALLTFGDLDPQNIVTGYNSTRYH